MLGGHAVNNSGSGVGFTPSHGRPLHVNARVLTRAFTFALAALMTSTPPPSRCFDQVFYKVAGGANNRLV